MKFRMFIFGAIIAALMLATSCTSGPDNPDIDKYTFIGGTEGLSMAFQEGAPPDEIFDAGQHPFTITVIVENVGEEDVLDEDFAEVSVLGISAEQFGLRDDDLYQPLLEGVQSLRGAAKLVDGTEVPGDLTSVSFGTLNYKPDLVGTTEILLRAELCYDYRTRSTTQICIKDNILDSLRSDKICSINELKIPQNSGGPVHVSQVKETPSGRDKVQISFTIEHVGTGLIFKKGSPLHCDDSLTNLDENWVWVDVWLPPESSDIKIECPLFFGGTSGYVQLFQGAPRQISCTMQGRGPSGNRVYQDVLHVDMEYTYLQFVEKPMIIRDVSTGY
jgi:hypothetical protein